jgi:hypothetical protein
VKVENAAETSAYFVNTSKTVGTNLIKYSFAWEIKHKKEHTLE